MAHPVTPGQQAQGGTGRQRSPSTPDARQIQRGTGEVTVRAAGPTKPFTGRPSRSVPDRVLSNCSFPSCRAQAPPVRVGRRGLLRSTALATWWRPVEVQRGIRVPGRSAHPPSWLTVVG